MSHPDHFALLALPARFALDPAALEAAHKAVQSRVHPDRYAAAGAAERRVAMQWAARANEAYATLKSPLARAAYLCERAGVPVEAESNTAMPTAFLMHQLEWREALHEARAAGDGARLAALAAEVAAERQQALDALAQSIDGAADYAQAAKQVRGLMFIEKFSDEVAAARAALADAAPLDR
jgi:molecular chaperone HscB